MLQDVVDNLIPDADISDAVIPLSVVAVDLRSGHMVVLEKGPLRDAVRASASLPGIFPPIPFNGMLLCDVGVFYSLPTTVARTYAPKKCLVAVDVSSDLSPLPACETAEQSGCIVTWSSFAEPAETDDWLDLYAAWAINRHLTLTGAYVDLGSIATFDGQRGLYLSLQAGF